MRLTVLTQITKGAPETIGAGEEQYELRPKVLKQLESIKWYLWPRQCLSSIASAGGPRNGFGRGGV
jgi:hypothetical protein